MPAKRLPPMGKGDAKMPPPPKPAAAAVKVLPKPKPKAPKGGKAAPVKAPVKAPGKAPAVGIPKGSPIPMPALTDAHPPAKASSSGGSIPWSGGFVSGPTPRRPGSATPIPAKSASQSRRRQVERYSNSYHSVSYLSDPGLIFL